MIVLLLHPKLQLTVHAGHPGVNAANAPPNTAEEFDFTEFIIFILFILYAIIAKLIPADAEIAIVNPIDVMMYVGDNSIAVSYIDIYT